MPTSNVTAGSPSIGLAEPIAMPHQARALAELVSSDAPSPGSTIMISYTRVLDLGERLGDMLRLEVARHLYNTEPLDEEDDSPYVRAIATSRPPILEGIARTSPDGLSALLSLGAVDNEPAYAGDNVVVPFAAAPTPPEPSAPSGIERSVVVVARKASPPDLVIVLQLLRIAEDGLAGLVAQRLAPHAPWAVSDASISVAAEISGQCARLAGSPDGVVASLSSAGFATLRMVIELGTRGHLDIADALATGIGRGDIPSDADAEDIAWVRECLMDIPEFPGVDAPNEVYEDARLSAAVALQHALEAREPETTSILRAIDAAARVQPLAEELLEAQAGQGEVVADRFPAHG